MCQNESSIIMRVTGRFTLAKCQIEVHLHSNAVIATNNTDTNNTIQAPPETYCQQAFQFQLYYVNLLKTKKGVQ